MLGLLLVEHLDYIALLLDVSERRLKSHILLLELSHLVNHAAGFFIRRRRNLSAGTVGDIIHRIVRSRQS